MLRGYVHFTRVSILVRYMFVPHATKVWLVPLKDIKGLILEPSTHHTVSYLGFLKNEASRCRALLVPVVGWNASPSPGHSKQLFRQ